MGDRTGNTVEQPGHLQETTIYEYILVHYNKLLKQVKGGIATDLAMAMPETPDETTLVVEMIPGVQCHDLAPTNGCEATAEDFVFSFTRLGIDDPAFQLRRVVEICTSFEVTEAQTLR